MRRKTKGTMTMRWWIPSLILALAFLVLNESPGLARSTGDPAARTGAPMLGGVPAEATCSAAGCHLGNPPETNGKLEILGVPLPYIPGSTYDLTVRLTSTATTGDPDRRWGFQLTAARLSDGLGTGVFAAPGLQILSGANSRKYVTHNVANVKTGASSPVEWTVSWTAPSTDEGAVGFYAAGVAGNGDLFASGDYVYTAADTTSGGVPVVPVTWGWLKSGSVWKTP
jgi:hypothetical protein